MWRVSLVPLDLTLISSAVASMVAKETASGWHRIGIKMIRETKHAAKAMQQTWVIIIYKKRHAGEWLFCSNNKLDPSGPICSILLYIYIKCIFSILCCNGPGEISALIKEYISLKTEILFTRRGLNIKKGLNIQDTDSRAHISDSLQDEFPLWTIIMKVCLIKVSCTSCPCSCRC